MAEISDGSIIIDHNEKCELIALQGRSLNPNSSMRYITIKIKEVPKIYGLERVDPEKTVYIVEGPLDSLFVENTLAMAGSDIDKSYFSDFSDVVFILDNEPRNQQIADKLLNIINDGFKVVLWPEKIKEKDINDIILSGIDTLELMDIISKNTVDDLEAKLRYSQWKKC